MRPTIVAGLDIGSTKTCAVIGEVLSEPRGRRLKILGIGQARTVGKGLRCRPNADSVV
jgi:cell division protein FtsA